MVQLTSHFLISEPGVIAAGLSYRYIQFLRNGIIQAQGRSLFIDLRQVGLKIVCFADLIDHNFWGVGASLSPHLPNFGMSLPDFFDPKKRHARHLQPNDLENILAACNTVHTNFVRGNGFVVADWKLISKPIGAIAIDGTTYVPLHGFYDCLILAPLPPKVTSVWIENNGIRTDGPIQLAISGPQMILRGNNIVHRIPIRPRDQGQTIGNEINYEPYTDRTSFTCFGITSQGELIILSMFAGDAQQRPGYHCFRAQPDVGITLNEMAELLLQLGATDAIAGGGSGDTQQYIRGHGVWVSMPRFQPRRGQVAGLRGLGAILVVKSQ